MASLIWDLEGHFLVDYMSHEAVTADAYCTAVVWNLNEAVRENVRECDKTCPVSQECFVHKLWKSLTAIRGLNYLLYN
jgi:hypothetical protein